MTTITILDAIDDPQLFKPWFRGAPTNWTGWRAFLAALFALPLSEEQAAVYRECTGRNALPTQPATEGWLLCGRRAGKSAMMSLVACWLALRDYSEYLAPGERASIMLIAVERKQARVLHRYVSAMLHNIPILAGLIEREWSDGFDLHNQVTIEIATCSYKTVRGYAIAAALLDEVAFFRSEDAANPDEEVLGALRPGMAGIPGSVLLCASSPYSKRGALWNAYAGHYGQDGDPVLVWQAATRRMNPTISQAVIDAAYERDPDVAASEWGALFRADVERIFTTEAVDAVVSPGVLERGRLPGVQYFCATDPSGGSADSFTIAIAHKEGNKIVLDAVRERRPPFSPEDIVNEFATLAHAYSVTTVFGDRYGGDFPRELFRKRGIDYRLHEKTCSDLFQRLVPLVNSRRIDLLDVPRLTAQLTGLERRTARASGKASISHPPGAHDYLAAVVAGVADVIGATLNAPVAGAWVWDRWTKQRVFVPLAQ
jgi:hypothetical protein